MPKKVVVAVKKPKKSSGSSKSKGKAPKGGLVMMMDLAPPPRIPGMMAGGPVGFGRSLPQPARRPITPPGLASRAMTGPRRRRTAGDTVGMAPAGPVGRRRRRRMMY